MTITNYYGDPNVSVDGGDGLTPGTPITRANNQVLQHMLTTFGAPTGNGNYKYNITAGTNPVPTSVNLFGVGGTAANRIDILSVGGELILDGEGTTDSSMFTGNHSGIGWTDCHFTNATNKLFQNYSGNSNYFLRCKFSEAADGADVQSQLYKFIECEFFDISNIGLRLASTNYMTLVDSCLFEDRNGVKNFSKAIFGQYYFTIKNTKFKLSGVPNSQTGVELTNHIATVEKCSFYTASQGNTRAIRNGGYTYLNDLLIENFDTAISASSGTTRSILIDRVTEYNCRQQANFNLTNGGTRYGGGDGVTSIAESPFVDAANGDFSPKNIQYVNERRAHSGTLRGAVQDTSHWGGGSSTPVLPTGVHHIESGIVT